MRIGLFLSASLLVSGGVQAQTKPPVVLVELFTSEGCSSCPPADALLRKLGGMRTDSGQMVVGISEHVTYWNQLGWADPFSQEAYTQRQNAYENRFHLDSVYTPQMVVNGEKQMVGSDSNGILKAIAFSGNSGMMLHIDSAISQMPVPATTLAVTFTVSGRVVKDVDVYAVIADDITTSSVLRGENSGRTLKHVSVARSLTKVATVREAKTVTVSLVIPSVLKGQDETKRHLIVFAQERGLGKVLAVESHAL